MIRASFLFLYLSLVSLFSLPVLSVDTGEPCPDPLSQMGAGVTPQLRQMADEPRVYVVTLIRAAPDTSEERQLRIQALKAQLSANKNIEILGTGNTGAKIRCTPAIAEELRQTLPQTYVSEARKFGFTDDPFDFKNIGQN